MNWVLCVLGCAVFPAANSDLMISEDSNSRPVLAGEMDWRHTWSESLREARHRNVPVVIHFYADWCAPCRQMERQVLGAEGLKSLLRSKVIGVKLNFDHSRELAHRFGVTSIPSDVFLSPQGEVWQTSTGFLGEDRYREMLSQSIIRANPSEVVQSAANTKPVSRADIKRGIETSLPTEPTEHPSWSSMSSSRSLSQAAVDSRRVPPEDEAIVRGAAAEVENTAAATVSEPIAPELRGFSPVSLLDSGEWKPGKAEFSRTVRGKLYLFCSSEDAAVFDSSPGKYLPCYEGRDCVDQATQGRWVPGRLEFGSVYRGRLLFFTSEANRELFQRNPATYFREPIDS